MVVATGSSTEFGAIFELMSSVEQKRTPLQLSMDELAKKLSILSFSIIGIICLISVLQQRSWLDMFTIGGENDCFMSLLRVDKLLTSFSLTCSRCYT